MVPLLVTLDHTRKFRITDSQCECLTTIAASIVCARVVKTRGLVFDATREVSD